MKLKEGGGAERKRGDNLQGEDLHVPAEEEGGETPCKLGAVHQMSQAGSICKPEAVTSHHLLHLTMPHLAQ